MTETDCRLGRLNFAEIGMRLVHAFVIADQMGHTTPRNTYRDYMSEETNAKAPLEAQFIYDVLTRDEEVRERWMDDEFIRLWMSAIRPQ